MQLEEVTLSQLLMYPKLLMFLLLLEFSESSDKEMPLTQIKELKHGTMVMQKVLLLSQS